MRRKHRWRFTRRASLARSLTAHSAAGLLLTLATLPVITSAQGNPQSATYRVTLEGKFTASALASGESVPSDEHFTTLIGAVHNGSVTFWSDGGTASPGIESMAEDGGTSALKAEINAAGSNALAVIEQSIASGGAATATVDITLTTDHPLVTLTSMVAPSPDWFVGVSGLSLRNTADNGWQPTLTVNLFPWDAGTEEGTEFSLSNPATSPQGTITSIKGTGKFSDEPIATLTFDLLSAPEITSIGPFEAEENTTEVGQLEAVDWDEEDEVAGYEVTGGADGALFIPVILSSAGRNRSFFTSELTLTNRGGDQVKLDYTYTSRDEPEKRSGMASDVLAAGRQQIETDALDYLRALGIPIPATGNQLGTLRVEAPLGSEVEAVVRTTTLVPDGRAGLAYPGVAAEEGFSEPVYLCGLRQNRQDRSNVAFQNMGTAEEGAITLKTTVYSGEAGDGNARELDDVELEPGGFHQYSGLLGSVENGYVKVERVEGEAPFYAYGVINDQGNSDGSFVFPVTGSSLEGKRALTLPVIVETRDFTSELTVTNFSEQPRTLEFEFVSEQIQGDDKRVEFSMEMEAGEQAIVPELVEELRRAEMAKLGTSRGFYLGPLFVTAKEGDLSGIVIGARTGSQGGGGQYSVFYNAVPEGEGSVREAWVEGLQQNEENRSNLALVNTGEFDDSPSVFHLEIYNGETGLLVETVATKPIAARGWHQIDGILLRANPETRQGYIRIEKMSGENPFLAYGVVNDGGAPGQRSGDGAYLPATEAIHDPEPMTDREVLELLYHATGGPDWEDRTQWLSDAPVSEWFGVETDGSGRVTNLDLKFNGLSGTIPDALGQLSALAFLNLAGNELFGKIPLEMGRLTNLLWLNLSDNRFSGGIPSELGGLAQLQLLQLQGNRLSGQIPPELGRLTNLTWLFLEENKLTGGIPPELGALTQLQLLQLQGNRLSGEIPPELGLLSRLERLYLDHNRLSGMVPSELGRLTQLEELYLGVNELSGMIPPELAGLTNLKRLSLRGTGLSGGIPPELGRLTNLERLELGGNKLSGGIPPELAGLTNLKRLSLRGTGLSGGIPPELAQLTNLRLLTLSFNPHLTGTIPPGLRQLPLILLDLMASSVCVPEDAEYQEWLEGIEDFSPSGLTCGRTPATVSSIDIAVFYTPAAQRVSGGTAEMQALIDLMIAETNKAYLDSQVNQRLVLVAREEVKYEEESDGRIAIRRLSNPSDGYMDEIHAIRDRSGADLVHLIADVNVVAGTAFLPGEYALTCASCDSTTFAHELGHNMGLSHDRYVERAAILPFSYGYVNQQAFVVGAPMSARWRTIMAYRNQCSDASFGCGRLMRFSNPNQTYLDDPLGVPGDDRTSAVAGPADAVRMLNLTRHSVAGWRPRASGDHLTMAATLSQARTAVGTGKAAAPVPASSLFRAIAPSVGGVASQQAGGVLDRATLRRRQVSVDIETLERLPDDRITALSLNLFDDVVLTGIIERRTPTFSGGFALSGRLAGVPGGTVTLVVNGSVVAGTVRIPGVTYRIRSDGAGRHAIMRIDPSRLPQGCKVEEKIGDVVELLE